MKATLLALSLLCLFVSGLALAQAGRPSKSGDPKAPTGTAGAAKVLGIEELMKHVDDHSGSITVEGVVSAVSKKDKRVALIDAAEFDKCGVVTCAEYTLPVLWAGELPAVKDRVTLHGKVETRDGKLLFVADVQRKVPPVVCTLTATQQGERKELLTGLSKAVLERREIEGGYAFRFAPAAGLGAKLGQIIDLERECCRFLTFRVVVEQDGGPVWLELTGPAGTREVLDGFFPKAGK